MASASSKDNSWLRGLKDFASGGVAGMAQIVVSHPFDTTRLQTQPKENPMFRGGLDCFLKTLRHEGVLALYKGMLSPLMGIAFVNAVLFGAYGRLRSLLHPDPGPAGTWELAVCGAGAGIANSVIASPVEMLKARLQVQYSAGSDRQFRGPLHLLTHIYRTEGIRGVYRGLGATVYREIPGYAAWYAVYENVRALLVRPDAKEVNPFKYMLAGAIGGISYWTACYPFDVVKTIIQTRGTHRKTWKCMKAIILEEGPRGLVKGYVPTVIRAVPAASSTFLTYEVMKQWLS